MDKAGTIFLTSTGLSSKNVYEEFRKIADSNNFKKAVIITTASLGKENNQYSQLALSQFKAVGFNLVDFYDFENEGSKDLSKYDVIYVCGGNTFKLMKFAREVNFDKEIKELLKRGGIYIGVSAGSLIMGLSIKIAAEISPDNNEVGLVDFSGFNFVDFVVFPHYSSKVEKAIEKFEANNNTKVERLNNSQTILVSGDKKETIE